MSTRPFADDVGHNTLLIIICCGLVLFMTLGSSEVQSWDEALFAMRARAVIEHDAWWDQSAYALGGMYSATYPPLSVWGMAVCMKALHMSPLSVRLFSVMCACATLFIVHALAVLMTGRKNAMLAAPLMSACLVWNHYARQGMSDVPLMMFILLALLAACMVMHRRDSTEQLTWSAVFGGAIAASLMTKITVSLIPLGFVFLPHLHSWLKARGHGDATRHLLEFGHDLDHMKKSKRALILSACVGFAVALPWYISMSLQHPGEFLSALTVPHLHSVVENNTRSLGVLYYVNQLLVSQPLTVLCVVWLVYAVRERASVVSFAHDAALEILLGLWFIAGLVVLSIAPTKNPHYTILILPPAVLLSMRGLDVLTHLSARRRTGLTILVVVVLAAVWAISQILRDQVRMLFVGDVHWGAVVFLMVSLTMIVGASRLSQTARTRWYPSLHRFVRVVVPVVLILRVAFLNVWGDDASKSAGTAAKWLEDSQTRDMVYVVHAHNASDSLAPQLAWYTKGWAGYAAHGPWRADYTFTPHLLSSTETDSSLSAFVSTVNVPIVYATPADTLQRSHDVELISRYHRTRLITRHYIIFSRRSYSNTEPAADAVLPNDESLF